MTMSVGSSGSDQKRTSQKGSPNQISTNRVDQAHFRHSPQSPKVGEDPKTQPPQPPLTFGVRTVPPRTLSTTQGVAPPNETDQETLAATLVPPPSNEPVHGAPIVGLGLAATPSCDQQFRAQPILLMSRYREAG